MQPPQALANGALRQRTLTPTRYDASLSMLLPTAKRFSRVPSMLDSLGVEVPYPA
jgi:hypothetical protein